MSYFARIATRLAPAPPLAGSGAGGLALAARALPRSLDGRAREPQAFDPFEPGDSSGGEAGALPPLPGAAAPDAPGATPRAADAADSLRVLLPPALSSPLAPLSPGAGVRSDRPQSSGGSRLELPPLDLASDASALDGVLLPSPGSASAQAALRAGAAPGAPAAPPQLEARGAGAGSEAALPAQAVPAALRHVLGRVERWMQGDPAPPTPVQSTAVPATPVVAPPRGGAPAVARARPAAPQRPLAQPLPALEPPTAAAPPSFQQSTPQQSTEHAEHAGAARADVGPAQDAPAPILRIGRIEVEVVPPAKPSSRVSAAPRARSAPAASLRGVDAGRAFGWRQQ